MEKKKKQTLHEELQTRPSTGARALVWETGRQDLKARGGMHPVLGSDATSSCLVLNAA